MRKFDLALFLGYNFYCAPKSWDPPFHAYDFSVEFQMIGS